MRNRSLFWIVLIAACGGLVAPATAKLPATLGYTFFVDGQPVGRTDIRVVETPGALKFESKTRVSTASGTIELTAQTEADPKTFAVRQFSFKGTKGDRPVETLVHVAGDSVYGEIALGGTRTPKALRLPKPRAVVFEDWLMELELLLALTQAQSKQKTSVYGLVFAGSFLPAELMAGFAGEVLVEAGERSFAARRLVVAITGAAPFESHVDPERGVPVYLRFPAVRAEVFLDEVFGDNPVTYFVPTQKGDK